MIAQPEYTESDMMNLRDAYENTMNQQHMQSEPSAFARGEDENLIKWQLELDNILERIDHLLRGHKITFDKGHIVWKATTNKDDIMFNDFGVNEILRILSLYLNRNTILSNYTEEEVKEKVYDFGIEINDLILCRYEDMGLDDEEKQKNIPMIIRELIDVVHSAYCRALKGGERQSLREARTVNQTQPMMSQTPYPMMPQKERSIFNPMRIFKR